MKEQVLTHQDLKRLEEYIIELYTTTELKSETYLNVLQAIREYTEKHNIKP